MGARGLEGFGRARGPQLESVQHLGFRIELYDKWNVLFMCISIFVRLQAPCRWSLSVIRCVKINPYEEWWIKIAITSNLNRLVFVVFRLEFGNFAVSPVAMRSTSEQATILSKNFNLSQKYYLKTIGWALASMLVIHSWRNNCLQTSTISRSQALGTVDRSYNPLTWFGFFSSKHFDLSVQSQKLSMTRWVCSTETDRSLCRWAKQYFARCQMFPSILSSIRNSHFLASLNWQRLMEYGSQMVWMELTLSCIDKFQAG